MEEAALCLLRDDVACADYLRGARIGVQARLTYYDELLAHINIMKTKR